MNYIDLYPHLTFKKDWNLSEKSQRLLGECSGIIKAISDTPILPKYREKLMRVALIKGAKSTAAIEGNTLTEEEIELIQQGKDIEPSKEYMKIEVRNILEAFTQLFLKVVNEGKSNLISCELINEMHAMIGKGLNEHFAAEPGRFRSNRVVVGGHPTPDSIHVQELMESYCQFLKDIFGYSSGRQEYYEVIVQAIVAHVYLEWIHPFGDGNGRTGRLIEFYILLRGKTPDIALHLLTNHYNLTRPEYYRQIQVAKVKRNLGEFIEYALVGFRDGLQRTLKTINESHLETTWTQYVHTTIDTMDWSEKTMKRKRNLVLGIVIDKEYTVKEIILASPKIARDYAGISERVIYKELAELVSAKLLTKTSNAKYKANTDILIEYIAKRKS